MADFIEAKMSGDLSAELDKWEAKAQAAILMEGVAAMARVIYDEAKVRAPVSGMGHWFYGTQYKKTGKKYFFDSGTLKASIYRAYSPEKSNIEKKTYRVSWNHIKAPYGFMVEFGTSKQPGQSFMRPAFGRVNDSIEAGKRRMAQVLENGGNK